MIRGILWVGVVTLSWAAVSIAEDEISPADIPAVASSSVALPPVDRLPEGKFWVGAARASLFPVPTSFGGNTWKVEGCTVYGTEGDQNLDQDHLLPPIDSGNLLGALRGWPAASADCIYLGGFGIGPVRPAAHVDDGGIWVRAIAISNGERTFVYEIADTVGWFSRYDESVCRDCGILDVREALAADLGLEVADVIIGSTHTHAGPDTYGGWGGIPSWYRKQIRDAAVAAGKRAVANMRMARITVGEVHLRDRNQERRDTYYSTADTGATWLQARETASEECVAANIAGCPRVIATWATYAGHPTIVSGLILHADWPGAAARHFETVFGGVGIVFEGGLGNVSVSGVGGETEDAKAEAAGQAIAQDVIADIVKGTNGTLLGSNEMATAVQEIAHPAMSNPGLATLGTAGLFDRELTQGTKGAGLPGVYTWSKAGELSSSGEDNDVDPTGRALRSCLTAGPTILTTAGAHRIGDFVVAFAPGEIFSNIAEVTKERADRTAATMVLGQTNDALGYIIQSFEFDSTTNVVTHYGLGMSEYEEVFAIDRCFGDHVLETLLESTRSLSAGG